MSIAKPLLSSPRVFLVGIALISGGVLLVELALTRLFSVTMFYHFAFLAISLAMFGTSAGAVFIHVTPGLHPPARLSGRLQIYSLLFAVTTVVATVVLLRMRIEMTYSPENLARMGFVYLLAALPFCAGGACIALALAHLHSEVHRIYAADLAGAAAGCLLLIPAVDVLGGPGALLGAALLGSLAAFCFSVAGSVARPLTYLGVIAAAVMAVVIQARSPYLDVVFAKGEERPSDYSKWNSFSRVAVYPLPHQEWGLSELYRGHRPKSLLMDIDASASTPILLCRSTAEAAFLRYEITALGHRILPNGAEALVIGPGGGRDIWTALVFGAKRVDGVEVNSIIAGDVMGKRFRAASGEIYFKPGVTVATDDGRSFVRRSDRKYDLIQASLVDTWAAASAGAFALTENNLYTTEAFVDYFEHLKPNGVLTVSRWTDDGLRLVALGREAGERLGWEKPNRHMFIASEGRLATFLFKKSPFNADELRNLEETSTEMGFKVLYSPDAATEYPDNDFARLAQTQDREAFYRDYPLDVSPPSDNRPFFFHAIKPQDLHTRFLSSGLLFGDGSAVLLNLLAISVVLVTLIILLPLARMPRPLPAPTTDSADLAPVTSRGLFAPLLYFSSIGLGFMFIEFGLMQRFTLFLGHPVYSLTVTLFTLLFAGGIGSALSRAITWHPSRLIGAAVLALVAIAVLYTFILPPLFNAWMAQDINVRIAATVLLLAPIGLLLGIPFPAGMQLVGRARPDAVAWMWATNGATSVLGATFAVLAAINLGFTAVLDIGCIFYGCALLSGLLMGRTKLAQPAGAQPPVRRIKRAQVLVWASRSAVLGVLLLCGFATYRVSSDVKQFQPAPPATYFDEILGIEPIPGLEEEGFYNREESNGQAFRWTNGAARLVVPVFEKSPQTISFALNLQNPQGTDLKIVVNGHVLLDKHFQPQPDWTGTFDVSAFDIGKQLVVELLTNTFTPSQTTPGVGDSRALGVAVKGVILPDTGRNCLNTTLGYAPKLGVEESGFYAPEALKGQAVRWTNGKARLVVPTGGKVPRSLSLVLNFVNPNGTDLRVMLNGRVLLEGNFKAQERWIKNISLAGVPEQPNLVIELLSNTFSAADIAPGAADNRALGLLVKVITLR